MNLNRINELSADQAKDEFLKCCGSPRWAEEMAAARPFRSNQELAERAEISWQNLSRQDWLQAFGAHPKIGDLESLKKKYSSTKTWAAGEQSGVDGASEQVLKDLAAFNQAYEDKFGYIFIVCATGKAADEMLLILTERLVNQPEVEFDIAIAEQRKITHLRLEKL